MPVQELKEISLDSQIHQPAIMYHFEYTNHDILLNVLFQNLYKLFLRARNPHQ